MSKRRDEKRWEEKKFKRKACPIDNIPAVLRSKTRLTQFLHTWVPDLNSCLSPLRNSYSIWPAIQYCTQASCISAWVIVWIRPGGRAFGMTWHLGESILPVSVVAVNGVCRWRVVSFVDTYHISFSRMVILTKFKCTRTVWSLCSDSAGTDYVAASSHQ